MKIVNIKQHEELYESFVFAKSVPNHPLSNFTFAEWLKVYMYIIAPAGVETFCESEVFDNDNEILLESNSGIDEGFFSDFRNILKGRKLIKAKYKGYDQAAKNYIGQSKKITASDDEKPVKDKKRIALKKQYDDTISQIDGKVDKDLNNLKKESPVVAKYEKFAKLKYQVNIFKLGKKAGVSMANVKAYNSELADLNRQIGDIAGTIKDTEEKIKDEKAKQEDKPKKEDDAPKQEN